MSLALPSLWAGQRPAWQSWEAPCCAAPALKTSEGSNITVNHSLPHPGSTCKPIPSSHCNREHRTRLAAPSNSFLSKFSPLKRSWRLCEQEWSHLTCVGTGGMIIAATTGSSISVATFMSTIQVVDVISSRQTHWGHLNVSAANPSYALSQVC